MGYEITFKFIVGAMVVTPLGASGVVTMVGRETGDVNVVFVATGEQGHADRWWPESNIRLIPAENTP